MRTDLAIVQYPNPLPDFGGLNGKNKIQTDPNFKTKIVRLTDASIANSHSMQVSMCGAWNTDDTLFMAVGTNGTGYIFQFNPITMQGRLMARRFPASAAFSKVNPGVVYYVKKSVVYKDVFEKDTTGNWVFKSESIVCDFVNVLPVGFIVKWVGLFKTSSDDSVFTVAFSTGIQNTSTNLCVFKQGFGYRMLDTTTGLISGQWGEVGQAHLISPMRTFPFYIHDAEQTPNSEYALIGPKSQAGWNDTSLVWFIPSLDLIDDNSGGHKSKGMLHIYASGAGGGKLQEIPYTAPTTRRQVIPANLLPASMGQFYQQDIHGNVGLLQATDQTITWMSAGGIPGLNPHVSCWVDEVRGVRIADGVTFRACSTFNSNKSQEYEVNGAIGFASQTGKFFAFTSDIMGTLGSITGAATGTPGVDARGDVFIVALT